MEIPIIQVDAFADAVFGGNPAAVCPLLDFPPDELLLSIAAENNLSETAFLVPVPGRYRLRWFTPTMEVDLCGHATLATAHVVFTRLRPEDDTVAFETRSGLLDVTRNGDLLTMSFPSLPATVGAAPAELLAALGEPAPREIHVVPRLHGADDFMLVYGSSQEVAQLRPDFSRVHANVIATAVGDGGIEAPDFVSRFFAPASGINEDPVTGSSHCTLAPYWAGVLGKATLVGRQISQRGGTVRCELRDERVLLSGRCVDYLVGTISV
ncbi:MAG: PhzF family phenazine biosynthesis protein [Myxococcota bacterium]